MKSIILFLIKFYKYNISAYLKLYFGGGCRFTPTCSEYAYDAVEKHGVIKGLFLSTKRVLRCNLTSSVRFDPVN